MRRIILWSCIPRSITGVRGESTLMFVYISASISRNANVLSPTSAYNSPKKKVKKTLGHTRRVSNIFFLKAGTLYCKGRTQKTGKGSRRWLNVQGLVPVHRENILPVQMTISSQWPQLLVTATSYCTMCNHVGAIYIICCRESKLRQGHAWAEPQLDCQTQLSSFPAAALHMVTGSPCSDESVSRWSLN